MNELLVIGNPSKRRRKRKSARRATSRKRRTHSRRRHSAKRKTVRVRARRNPSSRFGSLTSGVMPTLKDGAFGAVGGLANDLLYGFASDKLSFLPQAADGGIKRHLAKIASAILVGKLGNMVMRGKGGALARGAATTAIHAALKEQLITMLPAGSTLSAQLGEYLEQPAALGGYDPGMPVEGLMDEEREMGEYLEA